MNKQGAISGMVVGFIFTATYIIYFKLVNPTANISENWFFGISPEGIGTLGTILNVGCAYAVASFTADPPDDVQELVEVIRLPGEA